MADGIPNISSGSRGDYHWMTADQFELRQLLERCPQVVTERYVAITSLDSGAVGLEPEELTAGWRSRSGVAYSPRIEAVDSLLLGMCAGYDEWYVAHSALDLGQLSDDNVFENEMVPGKVFALVNFPHFRLNEGEDNPLVKPFWEQLEWIKPESYSCDTHDFLTFVSRNKDLFRNVLEAFRKPSHQL